ncbi:MAG: VanZ family protein [Nitrospirales bacterium]|nr:VanZ family protein [Nitrospirales bacterium]
MKKNIHFLLPLLYMGFIFYMSGRSHPLGVKLPYGADKVLHCAGYAFLGFLLGNALYTRAREKTIIIGLIVATLYGLTDEIHQSFVPGRDASVYDLMADSAGSFVGLLLYRKINNFKTYEGFREDS